MKITERMSSDPITVDPEASVDQALTLMRDHNVRHLPVVEEREVIGLVTDLELRSAWFASLLEELAVRDVMNAEFITVQENETVFQAARLLHRHKVTGLLVLQGQELKGIITLADMLQVMVETLGLLSDSIRLDVALKPGAHPLQEALHLVSQAGGRVISVAHFLTKDGDKVCSLRMEKTDPAPLASVLEQAGHRVLG